MVYDEAARRLYGPDAYLNLPTCNAAIIHRTSLRSSNGSIPSKNFMSMFPSFGLLDLNGQHKVHVIHQKLQELKKNSGFSGPRIHLPLLVMNQCLNPPERMLKAATMEAQYQTLTEKVI